MSVGLWNRERLARQTSVDLQRLLRAHTRNYRDHCVADQGVQQGWQTEPAIEPVGEGAEVVAGALGELERIAAAADGRLQVAQDGVDPGELRHVARLGIADDERVSAARVGDSDKAAQAVAVHVAAWRQIGACPVGDDLAGEDHQRQELDAHGVAAVVGGDGCDDRHLGGIATAYGARVLAAGNRQASAAPSAPPRTAPRCRSGRRTQTVAPRAGTGFGSSTC